jgi:plasmid stabilization system protein ParE
MTVAWSQTALDDRARFLAQAEEQDPQIYAAAERQDDQLELEGNALDGVATYAEGPTAGTRLYPCKSGKYVIIYTRSGNHVEILWIAPSRSNWKPTP